MAGVLGALTFIFRYLSYNGFPNDHFVHLSTAQQMLLGELPVRDFVERGMPMMSAVSAAMQVVLGPGLRAELVLVAAAFGLAAAALFVVAAMAARSSMSALAAAVATVAAAPVSYAYPKHLLYAVAFAAAWWYSRDPRRSRLVLLALTVAAAFLFRHDHGLVLGAGTVALLLAVHGRAAVRPVAVFAGIVLVAVAPFVAWVQAYQGIGSYVEDGIAFSRREADRSRGWWPPPPFAVDRSQPLVSRLGEKPEINVRWRPDLDAAGMAARERAHGLKRLVPEGPGVWRYEMGRWSSSAIAALVRDPDVADTQGIDREAFVLSEPVPWYTGWPVPGPGMQMAGNSVALLFWVVWAVPAVCLVVLAASRAARQSPAAPLVVMVALVQLGLNATMLRDPLILRVRDVLVPAALALALAAAALSRLDGRLAVRMALRAGAVAGLGVFALAAGAAGGVVERIDLANVRGGLAGMRGRAAQIASDLAPPHHRIGRVDDGDEDVAAYLAACTPPDARVFVMAFEPELFFYAGRGFGGGHVTLTPGYYVTAEDEALMVERLSQDNVPIVLFDQETRDEYVRDYRDVTNFIARRYREAGRFPIRSGEMIVWADATRTPARTYGRTALPCFAPAA